MHVHRYRVLASSTFGLKRVNAYLECEGVVDKKPCGNRLQKLLSYDDCEKVMKGRGGKITYFWQPREVVNG